MNSGRKQRPWSVWGDAAQIAQYNPLRRVPTLLLEDGTALVETFAILDAIDELVGPERALLPESGALRRAGLRVAALAAGVADKAVTLLYSSLDLMKPSEAWSERCKAQVVETLAMLETERAAQSTPFWLGESLSHADVALACAYRFTNDAHPALIDARRFPSLSAQVARCEALRVFQRVYLPITNHLERA